MLILWNDEVGDILVDFFLELILENIRVSSFVYVLGHDFLHRRDLYIKLFHLDRLVYPLRNLN